MGAEYVASLGGSGYNSHGATSSVGPVAVDCRCDLTDGARTDGGLDSGRARRGERGRSSSGIVSSGPGWSSQGVTSSVGPVAVDERLDRTDGV